MTLVHGTYNRILEMLSHDDDELPSETDLSRELKVSRTVIRKAIEIMIEKGIVRSPGRPKKRKRAVRESDYFPLEPHRKSSETIIRQFFIDQMKNGAIRPGDRFSVLELATESGCNRSIVREFLYEFGKYGLIEKMPRKMWRMVAIDRKYIAELTETREILELKALEHLWQSPQPAPIWKRLNRIRSLFDCILEKQGKTDRETDFWPLDEELYRSIVANQNNRFVSQFYSIIYFVFTLHYQWCLSEESGHVDSVLALDREFLENILQREKEASADIVRRHCEIARTLFAEAVHMLTFP